MSSREQYAPGAASGAEVRRDGEKWTLVLVRDLSHPPAKVWKALTDPEHLREWAPFDSDRNLGKVGTAKLSTVGAPTPQVSETQVKRADAPKVLEFSWGGTGHPLGTGAAGRRRHPAHALAQHRPWIHIDGRCGLAHLLRCAGAASRRSAHWTHRRRRGHEVRRLAAIERRVRKAARRRDPRLALSTDLSLPRSKGMVIGAACRPRRRAPDRKRTQLPRRCRNHQTATAASTVRPATTHQIRRFEPVTSSTAAVHVGARSSAGTASAASAGRSAQ